MLYKNKTEQVLVLSIEGKVVKLLPHQTINLQDSVGMLYSSVLEKMESSPIKVEEKPIQAPLAKKEEKPLLVDSPVVINSGETLRTVGSSPNIKTEEKLLVDSPGTVLEEIKTEKKKGKKWRKY